MGEARVGWCHPDLALRVSAKAPERKGWDVDEADVAQSLVGEEDVRAVRPHLLHLAPHRGGRRRRRRRRLGLARDLLPPIAHLLGLGLGLGLG